MYLALLAGRIAKECKMIATGTALWQEILKAEDYLRPQTIVRRYRQIIAITSREESPLGVTMEEMRETVIAFDAMRPVWVETVLS
jgi:hypothetical protein